MNALTTANVACAINIVEFDEPAHLVYIGESDARRYEQHEEAFLRELGVIPDGQPLHGLIDETPNVHVVGNTDPSAAPAAPKATVCIMQHITEGGCSCTYRKKCFKVALPTGPGTPTDASGIGTCGDTESFTARIDHTLEILISPRALRALILDPERLCGIIDLGGRPFNGIIPLLDLDLLNLNAWHLQEWAHIVEGSCKCKYLPLSAKEVEVSHFKIGHHSG